jgi:prolipoprotein diacylglyceryltransferase
VLSLLDAFIPLVPVGIFFWRFGNFLNQELYGTIIPSGFWGLSSWLVQIALDIELFHVYDKIWPQLRINTNFLSMMFEWLLLAIVLRICFFRYWKDKIWSAWQLSAVFLGGYSLVRFVLEYLRQDSQAEFVWWFTKSQWFFVVFMVVAIVVFVIQWKQQKN